MSKVDFYVIRSAGEHSRRHFACRLAEKAYRLQNTVHIVAADRQSAQQLDELLWTFSDGSFVPHEVVGAVPGDAPAPVTIGVSGERAPDGDLLINLCDEIPPAAESFPRVAEIVSADNDGKASSRQRFVDYRDRGHTLDTHML